MKLSNLWKKACKCLINYRTFYPILEFSPVIFHILLTLNPDEMKPSKTFQTIWVHILKKKKSKIYRKLLIQKKKLLNYQSNGRFVKRYFMFFWNNQSSLMTLIFISDRTFWIEGGSKDCGILHQMFYVFHHYYYGLVWF